MPCNQYRWNLLAGSQATTRFDQTVKIEFEDFILDTEEKTVTGPDGPVALRAQTYAVLCCLIERAPSVVAVDELLDQVWGHQATSVSSVPQTIKELRQALGDSSTEPRMIATRRRLGYQFIAPVTQVSAPEPSSEQPGDDPVPATRLPAWLIPGLIVLAAAVVASGLWRSEQPPLAERSEQLPTLAVAEMVNSSDDPELNWLGPALETYLGHALVELGGFRVVAVDRASREDELALLDVDFLVEGRFLAAGIDGSRLLASLRRPGSGEIVTSLESGLPDWDVAGLSIAMASAIRERLGYEPPPGADAGAIRARLPRLPSSQRAYFTAVEAIALREPGRALEQIAAARGHEPDNPRLDHLQSLALALGGDLESARQASSRALTATNLWPRRDRLDIEATAAMLDFDFDLAADRLQALNEFFPEPASSLRLIQALIGAGRLQAAAEGLASLRLKMPRDAQLALLEAELARVERRRQDQVEHARRGVELAREQQLESLVVAGLLSELQAWIESGESAEAMAVLTELEQDLSELSLADQARIALTTARLKLLKGEIDAALTSAELAETLYQEIPAPAGLAETWQVMGAIYEAAGRLDQANEALGLAVAEFARIGDQRQLARARVGYGSTLSLASRIDEAIDQLGQAAGHFRAVRDRQGEGAALLNHGTLLARSGRLFDSEPVFERALEAFADAGDLRGQAITLGNLAGVAGERRDTSRSVELAEQSLLLFELLDARNDIARVSYNLGVLLRRQGELLDAELRINQAAEAFAGQGALLMQSRALTTLGRLLISMGRMDELNVLIEQLDALAIEDPTELSAIHALLGDRALAGMDTETARGHFEQAFDLLDQIGASTLLLVARLDLARVDLADGLLIDAEQSARDLLFAFGEIRHSNRQVDALLILAEALIGQQRFADAESALGQANTLLAEAPDAEQSLRLALVRSQLPADPELSRQRLDWVARKAGEQGFLPLVEQATLLR